MNFNIITLGCKVNQYESQAMREDMLKNGFLLSDDRDRADITIVNSCTVTSVSDAKNRKILNRVRRENPDGIVILTGCMPQAFPEESENFSNCDIVLGNAKRAELVPSIYKFLEEKQKFVHITEHIGKGEKYENLSVSSLGEHTRVFIKIEDGCNRFCSYCIIPYARGRVRSKSLEDLKAELIQVAANGYREVVLVGINLSAYGLDEDFDLADAVECACSVDGIDRVRLGSIEPERMDKEMIVKSIGFAKVHIFPYSRRKGTVADKAPNQIDPQIKEQRAKIMEQVCDETRREFLKDQVGLCESVLVERLRHGYLEGYTKNYTPVHINSEDTSLCGKIIDVKITKSFDDYCDAELV